MYLTYIRLLHIGFERGEDWRAKDKVGGELEFKFWEKILPDLEAQ